MINISDLKMITKESSKGNQFKFHINSTWYKADQFGYEGLAEAISTNILRFSNIYRFCEYSLEEIKYKDQEYTGCKSKDFLYPGETLISLEKIGRLYKNTSIGLFLSGHAMTEDKIQSTLSFLHSLRIPKIDSYIK